MATQEKAANTVPIYPTFASKAPEEKFTGRLKKMQAAAMLDVSYTQLRSRFLMSGLIEDGKTLAADEVEALVERPFLEATSGALTVIRSPGKEGRDGDSDPILSVDDTDAELEATSLRWWRGKPDKFMENRLLVATASRYPIVLWELYDVLEARRDGREVRYQFAGRMLARLKRRDALTENKSYNAEDVRSVPWVPGESDDRILIDDPRLHYVAVYDARYVTEGTPQFEAVKAVMSHRIVAESGGTVGYLSANRDDDDA